ncbi:MAG: twin-arginine translocase TatA/TatE family subunit [Rhodospirillales bacterium CG15_BIG_FIL_POST_REV_8_21_14_020_66_15]|nr:MAG: twin-arginine translocase TatA/TatE family subunit [Rhodospirillales bacterium CG15_BIG_FIL_POST_REV_8_21_14_020_66_15]
MGTFSIWHWLVVLVVVLVLFGGGGKISRLMGDFGKGLKSFKKSMKEDDEAPAEGTAERKAIDAEQADKPSQTATAEKDQAAS